METSESYAAERKSLDIDEFLSFNIPECERPYAFWLVSVPWIGQGPVPSLLELYGSPKEIFEKSVFSNVSHLSSLFSRIFSLSFSAPVILKKSSLEKPKYLPIC